MFVGEDQAQGGSAEPREASAAGRSAGAEEMPLERLEHEIVQLASHINAAMCRWLELVAEFDRREGWGSWSCKSCAEWVAWRCAMEPRSAREHVRVARALAGVPRIREAFARGQLSYSKVRALTRVADANSEAELLELAEHATAAQLERIVRGLRRATTDEANEQHADRHLSAWWEGDGSLSISGNMPAEEGAAFMAALDAMHDLLRSCAPDRGSAEPLDEPQEPRETTNADALSAMAEAAMASETERSGGERREIVVHVDAETLAQDPADPPGGASEDVAERPGSARIEDGSALAPETIRRLACDCSIVPLLEGADGETLSLGRRRRSVSAALERALRARDGTCVFPGCENRRFLETHHVVHWAHGGETDPDNCVRLCGRHHRLLHEGGYSVERLGSGELRFVNGFGRVLRDAPPAPHGDPGAIPRSAAPLHAGSGERLDLDLTLSGLLPRWPGGSG